MTTMLAGGAAECVVQARHHGRCGHYRGCSEAPTAPTAGAPHLASALGCRFQLNCDELEAASAVVPHLAHEPASPEHGGRHRSHPEADASPHPPPVHRLRPSVLPHEFSSGRDRLDADPGPQGRRADPSELSPAGSRTPPYGVSGGSSDHRTGLRGGRVGSSGAERYPAGRPGVPRGAAVCQYAYR